MLTRGHISGQTLSLMPCPLCEKVEQYQWDEMADAELMGQGVSAAASGETGPPPIAVAISSSLFSTEVTQARSPSKLKPPGASAAQVPVGLPQGSYSLMQQQQQQQQLAIANGSANSGALVPSGMLLGNGSTALDMQAMDGGPSLAAGSSANHRQSASTERNLESLELELEQRERLLAWAQAQQSLGSEQGSGGGRAVGKNSSGGGVTPSSDPWSVQQQLGSGAASPLGPAGPRPSPLGPANPPLPPKSPLVAGGGGIGALADNEEELYRNFTLGSNGNRAAPPVDHPIPDFIRMPGEEGEEEQERMFAEMAAAEAQEMDPYQVRRPSYRHQVAPSRICVLHFRLWQGQWHKPPEFNDGHDHDKE